MRLKRVEELVSGFDAQCIDALLLIGAPSMALAPNIFYLTGFKGSTAHLIITPTRRLFLTDSRYTEIAHDIVTDFEIIDVTGKKQADFLKEYVTSLGIGKLGIESAHVPVATFNHLRDALSPAELVPTNGLLENLRMLKDDTEIALIREAIRVNEESFEHTLTYVCEGVSERDLASEFEYALRKRGGEMASFSPIVASGPNSSKPHAGFTDQKILPGCPLKFDVGVMKDGYCSDMTRTVFVENCPEVWRKRYDAVLAGKRAAESVIKAGIKGAEADFAARRTIVDAGFGDVVYTHGLGHALGIEVHEQPIFALGAENVIPARSVLSVEPGIYVPGEGGIRIEDLVMVTENGIENLNSLSCELRVVG